VRTLCAVLHDTGCRESELLEVTPERVDLTGGCIVFRTLKKRAYPTEPPVLPDLLPEIRTPVKVISSRHAYEAFVAQQRKMQYILHEDGDST
jgi:hypothetical protein